MTAKLLVREVGGREFVQHNGEFEGSPARDGFAYADGQEAVSAEPERTDLQNAEREGERLCAEGNVEAFQVWQLVSTKQRVWKLEEVS